MSDKRDDLPYMWSLLKTALTSGTVTFIVSVLLIVALYMAFITLIPSE